MSYKILLTRLVNKEMPAANWCLDSPLDQELQTAQALTENGLFLLGWVLFDNPDCYRNHHIYLQQGPEQDITTIPIKRNRPDVVQSHRLAQAHLVCGFKQHIELTHDTFEVGLIDEDGQCYPWFKGHVSSPLRVLEGKQGWLFLDNDTNNSVAQHTGDLLLHAAEQAKWSTYAAQLAQIAEAHRARHAFLIAPAKEAVYQDMHPLPRALETVSDKVMLTIDAACKVVNPENVLVEKRSHEETFRRKDSHWSPYGAMLAVKQLMLTLGAPRQRVDALFVNDKYQRRQLGGDLGNKCFPPQRAEEWVQTSFRYRKHIVYDNELDNFGRVLMTYYEQSLSRKRLLLFGSSSSYTMLNFLSRAFRQVIFIHSAGNLDPKWVEQLKPNYLVAQTNARFMIRSPSCDYSVRDEQAEKLRLHKEKLSRCEVLQQTIADVPEPMQDCVAWAQKELHQASEEAAKNFVGK